MAIENITGSNIDLQSLEVKNPFPLYAEMREKHPVCQLKGDNMWALTRYQDVKFALERPDLFSASGQKALLQPKWFPEELDRDLFIASQDPPEHTERRKLINKAFVGKEVQALLPVMQKAALKELEKIQPSTPVDFMSAFVRPYVCELSDKIIGADSKACLQELGRWIQLNKSNLSENPAPDYIDTLKAAVRRQNANFDSTIKSKRHMPQTDLITNLMQEKLHGKNLTNCQLRNILELIITASIYAPAQMLCQTIIELIKRPETWHTLKTDPDKVPAFIEEALRYSSVVRVLLRRTIQPVKLSEGTIPKEALVFLIVASANHDPMQFKHPDVFDMARSNNKQHLGFGFGAHICIGAALARQQMKIAVETILDNFDEINIPPGSQIKTTPSWLMNIVEELPVTFH